MSVVFDADQGDEMRRSFRHRDRIPGRDRPPDDLGSDPNPVAYSHQLARRWSIGARHGSRRHALPRSGKPLGNVAHQSCYDGRITNPISAVTVATDTDQAMPGAFDIVGAPVAC